MLYKISRYAIILIIIIIAGLQLPDFYWKLVSKKQRRPIINYSHVIDDFVVYRLNDSKTIHYVDLNGKEYTRKEYSQLFPLRYCNDLAKWGKLPKTFKGYELDIHTIQKSKIHFKTKASDFNLPQIKLYTLFESKSDYTNLETPDEVFRINNRIEFINTLTNSVNEEKSQLFTSKLKEVGFKFPSQQIAGNPSPRKPFDEGYFIIDADGYVFHLKQMKGKPFCVKTNIPHNLNIKKMFVMENNLKEFYGWMMTESNDIYLITYNDYKLIKLPVKNYDSNNMFFAFFGDLLGRTIKISNSEITTCIALDKDYNLIDSYSIDLVTQNKKLAGKIESIIFPFSIDTLSYHNSRFIHFDIIWGNAYGLIGIFLSLIVTFFVKKHQNLPIKENWFDFIIVAFSGIYGCLAVLIIKPEHWD